MLFCFSVSRTKIQEAALFRYKLLYCFVRLLLFNKFSHPMAHLLFIITDEPANKRSNTFTNILQPIMMTSEVGTVQAQVHHRQVKVLWIGRVFYLCSIHWFSKDYDNLANLVTSIKRFLCFFFFVFGGLLIGLASQNC